MLRTLQHQRCNAWLVSGGKRFASKDHHGDHHEKEEVEKIERQLDTYRCVEKCCVDGFGEAVFMFVFFKG